MFFQQHACPVLNDLFALRSFQGQNPTEAKVIFFGRDANYPENIENNEARPDCFALLRQYHEDGVGFWQNKYGKNPVQKHHPFLICMRHGDPGYKYHKVFSEIKGMDSSYAAHISFVELLKVPTMGDPHDDTERRFDKLLSQSAEHLDRLVRQLSSCNFRRAVFIPDCAIKEMRKIYIAPFFYQQIFLRNGPLETYCPKLIFRYRNVDIYKCYHFSDSRGRSQLDFMKDIIDDYI